MKTNKLFMLLIFFIGSISLASAQKFGYVNTQELLAGLPEVKEAESTLETFKTQLEKQYQSRIKTLQDKYQTLQRQQDNGELSPKQLEIEAQKLKAEETQLGQFSTESQQKIMEKTNLLLGPIQEKIKTAINSVATEGGYSYIFDYSLGVILYADEATNVGDQVKAKLNM